MKNKTIITGILLSVAIGLFLLPAVYSQEGLVDTEVIVSVSQITDNDNNADGKVKVILFIASGPTYTLSGASDMVYYDRVVLDITKPGTWDNKITNSVTAKEIPNGRNVTKIRSFPDKRVIYP